MKNVLFSGLLAMAAGLPGNALAQKQVCGERDLIVHELENKHGEFLRSAGLQDNMIMVEIYASDEGNWTILYTKPSGQSCFMAVGKAWEDQIEVEAPKTGTAL
ncbi:MAG: hypothetical protein AAF718_10385 [Pseudomonadota bacterium]